MTDEELLAIVKAERVRSIGFDHDETLHSERERALNYRKGIMPDVPSLPNRSAAVSTDVADAVETVLPDLIEIFTGGDDVAAFLPTPKSVDPEAIKAAEQQAQQETDYVNHVVFEENPGFMILYAMFKDALEVKTGVVKWWWEDADEVEPEQFEGKTGVELQLAIQNGGKLVSDPTPSKYDDDDDQPAEPTYDFALENEQDDGRVCIEAVAPEDFTVSPDTIRLKDAPYCAHRSRPRAQDLIARGIDPELVDQLGAYDADADDSIKQARDTAGEHDNPETNDATRALRQVEVIEHYIRINEGDKPKIWRVLTGKNEALLLDKEEVSEIQFAAITPYVITHRFYGESVADKLMEVQKIKTVLTRMQLDSGYFALNQRNEVDMSGANEFTISDLLRNEPAMPVRVNRQGTVTPLQAGALQFDVMGALEHWSTVAEQRTGVVRNAQGLNPDTLHDTAKGAIALMAAAQKRVRMIARVFAEGGLKDLFLGVHALLRRHSSKPAITKLRGSWVAVDPTTWSERDNMTIEVGLGASGVDAEMAAFNTAMPVFEQLVATQSPIFPADKQYAVMNRFVAKGLRWRNPELYLTDPATVPQQPATPDPEMIKAQAAAQQAQQQMQLDAAKAQADAQTKAQQAQADFALQQQKGQADLQLQGQKNDLAIQLEREKAAVQLQLQQQVAAAELELKRQQMELEASLKARQQDHNESMAERKQTHAESTDIAGPHLGGKPG
jgi:hypothetical protein